MQFSVEMLFLVFIMNERTIVANKGKLFGFLFNLFSLFFLKRTMTSMTLVRALNRIYVFLNHSNDGIITLY